ncbi:NACHT domain-containing protein [Phytomonospora endophytica]|uniref:NACHT domain-containing protein n=1 Tax=Phytomonospora endophytica TaxID=714109 RepID=A0A841FVS7_9ACTN|nr:NACHT domain-containing protein [Phytomonospora endophytica]MBB6037437.1 hypothetical protein [Phytomonospora endophytica]GIG70687.1 hypothetical protein Pen01_69820 [Phytomonospora endophytica]
MIVGFGFTWGMAVHGGSGPGKSGGQLVGLGLVGLGGVLGTTLATQFGLAPWLTAVVALGITVPLAFVLLVVQNLFLKWAPASSDRIDRRLRRHRKRYLESLHEHVRHLEVLGVATQGEFTLKLGDVYVDVALVPKSAVDFGAAKIRRRSLLEVIEKSESGVVAVIGGPGSGKTTLLRHQTLSMSTQKRGRLPILLEIRQHAQVIVADPEVSLAALAASSRTPPEWLAARLHARDCLVMLDGLDEVAGEDQRRMVVEWLRRQIGAYPGNRFVITSRSYGYDENPLAKADRVEVQPFTDAQVARFLRAWYEAVERRGTGEDGPATSARARQAADDLLSRLADHPALAEFSANPLLLTMIALVHRYRGALPGTRARLYEEMCAVLLHRRREAKGLASPKTELSGEQKEHVARVLACRMMERRLRDIPVEDAHAVVREALLRMRPVEAAGAFLREAVRSGLLVEPQEGTLAFAHLTLQEYLAAADIKARGASDFLLDLVADPWWSETIRLWASGSDVTALLRRCVEANVSDAVALALDAVDLGREADAEAVTALLADADRRVDTVFRARRLDRWLQETTRLSTGAALTAPISWEQTYSTFFRPRALAVATEVPFGVAASLAASWVAGEILYRLPTPAEIEDRRAPEFGPHCVWVQLPESVGLWCPPGVVDPFEISGEQVASLVTADIGRRAPRRVYEEGPVAFGLGAILEHLADPACGEWPEVVRAPLDELAANTRLLVSAPRRYRALASRRARVVVVECFERMDGGPKSLLSLLGFALRTLAVHELRANGTITPNEILVLARD